MPAAIRLLQLISALKTNSKPENEASLLTQLHAEMDVITHAMNPRDSSNLFGGNPCCAMHAA